MGKRITFEKLSKYLYDVKIDGRESRLSVIWEDGRFYCQCRDFFNLRTRTLEKMREEIASAIEF